MKKVIPYALVLALALSSYWVVESIRHPSPYAYKSAKAQRQQLNRLRLNGKLELTLFKRDPVTGRFRSFFFGPYKNLIVDSGENFLVDAWQNTVELENMRYHGIGTGSTAAAESDTGCQTELTTQYNPDNTRATGSLGEGSASNIFRTVGTNTVDASAAVTEWCLMSQASTGGGTMWSRVVFSTINLANGDSLQTTYDLTVE